MNIRFSLLFLILLTIACREHKTSQRILAKDVYAEGDISLDTVYNGLIKFYDTATNKLVIEAFYKNGKLDGKRSNYYLNGSLQSVLHYESGKQNGNASYFDSTGQVESKQDFYYDLEAGSKIQYKKGKPDKYYFTSFDHNDLFYLDYDSVYNIAIEKLNDSGFFFWHVNDIATFTTTNNILTQKEGFIYIIDPPGFHFEYSLCVINNKDSVLRIEKLFSPSKIWDSFIFDPSTLKTTERFALRLEFDRTYNNNEREKGEMLKRL